MHNCINTEVRFCALLTEGGDPRMQLHRARSSPAGLSANFDKRLSDKSLEGSQRFRIAVLKVAKWCFWVRFEHSLESRSGPFRNYQTVSLGNTLAICGRKG